MEKRKRSLAIDMLNGSMWDKILLYALPVAATGILGQLFNASDVAIVGNFASTGPTESRQSLRSVRTALS